MKKLFGTDGVRGKANEFPLRPEDLIRFGQSLAYLVKQQDFYSNKSHYSVLIGKDTRLSGYMIEQTLAAALNSLGVHVTLVGPVPTPAVSFLVQSMRADAGIMISASHNPYYDNGIKIFGHDGCKVSNKSQNDIEDLFFNKNFSQDLSVESKIGRTKRIEDVSGRYIVYVKNTFPINLTLDGLKIVLDCANGCSYSIAPKVFEELGADVISVGDRPNGLNINKECGALHPELACQRVIETGAQLGICLDGDADRVLFIDRHGKPIPGDILLGLAAIFLKKRRDLHKNTLVVTQMSNMGLDRSLKKLGIDVVRTPVGDRFVSQKLFEGNYSLGGENSGHIIFKKHTPTGDGCVAALSILSLLIEEKVSFKDLASQIKLLPYVSKNISFNSEKTLKDLNSHYHKRKNSLESRLEKVGGRMLIRASGTEKKIRLLLEGALPEKDLNSMASELEFLISEGLC